MTFHGPRSVCPLLISQPCGSPDLPKCKTPPCPVSFSDFVTLIVKCVSQPSFVFSSLLLPLPRMAVITRWGQLHTCVITFIGRFSGHSWCPGSRQWAGLTRFWVKCISCHTSYNSAACPHSRKQVR